MWINQKGMMRIFYSFMLLSVMMFASCRNDKIEEPNAFNPDCDEIISFNAEIISVMINSCATSGCHNQGIASAGYIFENHAQIAENAEMILATIRHQPGVVAMPVGQQLPQAFIEKFFCWMEQGKQNN